MYNYVEIENKIENGVEVVIKECNVEKMIVEYFNDVYEFRYPANSIKELASKVVKEKKRIKEIDKSSRLQYTTSLRRKVEQRKEWNGYLKGWMEK